MRHVRCAVRRRIHKVKRWKMKSIISNEKKCFICGAEQNIEYHHIYSGANRKISDKHGFTVYLCSQCHLEVTDNKNWKDGYLKALCQAAFESKNSRETFMKLIGRNYLD